MILPDPPEDTLQGLLREVRHHQRRVAAMTCTMEEHEEARLRAGKQRECAIIDLAGARSALLAFVDAEPAGSVRMTATQALASKEPGLGRPRVITGAGWSLECRAWDRSAEYLRRRLREVHKHAQSYGLALEPFQVSSRERDKLSDDVAFGWDPSSDSLSWGGVPLHVVDQAFVDASDAELDALMRRGFREMAETPSLKPK